VDLMACRQYVMRAVAAMLMQPMCSPDGPEVGMILAPGLLRCHSLPRSPKQHLLSDSICGQVLSSYTFL